MGRLRIFGLEIVLLTGLAVPSFVLAAGPGEDRTSPDKKATSWWPSWFGSRERALDTALPAKTETIVKKDTAVTKHPTPNNDSRSDRAREQETLLRRLEVCDKLRLVAIQTRDDALLRRADELDQRALEIFSGRVARMPGSVSPDPLAEERPDQKPVGEEKR
jgi:hypothetical protein